MIFGLWMLTVLNFSFLGQHFKVYAYLFDNANFTEKHCVNKNLPESTCKGACQMKQLADDEDQDSTPIRPDYKSVDVFVCGVLVIDFSQYKSAKPSVSHSVIGFLTTGFFSDPSPPPNAV